MTPDPARHAARPATVATDPAIWAGSCYVNLTDPNPAEFRLEDIARGLSHAARFAGLTAEPYTVAEHALSCLMIARRRGWSDPGILRAVLFHDAAEAYLGDIPSPLKALLPDYRRIEARFEAALFARFGVGLPLYRHRVQVIDTAALAAEKRAFFPDAGPWWCDGLDDGEPPLRLPRDLARHLFLEACADLGVA